MSVKRAAIISCYDKQGILPFAEGLLSVGLTVLASSGTHRHLLDYGISSIRVEDYTNQANGCLSKTLQSKLHEGMLVDQDRHDELQRLAKSNIFPVRVLYCEIYPFGEKTKGSNCSFAEAKKYIDVGGPAMLTCAARNYQSIFVLTDKADFGSVLQALSRPLNESVGFRRTLAAKAIRYLHGYYSDLLYFLDSKGD